MGARLPRWLVGVSLAVYAFLHVPILVLVVFSFNDSKFSVDWAGFTLDWYHRLLERPDILRGLKASLIVGGASTVISAVLGTMIAPGARPAPVPRPHRLSRAFSTCRSSRPRSWSASRC